MILANQDRVRRYALALTGLMLLLIGPFSRTSPAAEPLQPPLGSTAAETASWLQVEIRKTETEISRENDVARKRELLNYLDELHEFQEKYIAKAQKKAGVHVKDLRVDHEKSWADFDFAGSMADGRYPLVSSTVEERDKAGTYRLILLFEMTKKGWQKFPQEIECLLEESGGKIILTDPQGRTHALSGGAEAGSLVMRQEGSTKTISRQPARESVDFAVSSGKIHLEIDF